MYLKNYYIDTKIHEKDGKIDMSVYNPKWQQLFDSLLNKDYN